MNRRELLAGSGIVLSTALGGCLGSTDNGSSGNGNGNGNGNSSGSTGEYGLPSCASSDRDVKVLTASMRTEQRMKVNDQGNPTTGPHAIASGRIRNEGDGPLSVDITATFYDGDGELGEAILADEDTGEAYYYELEAGEETQFELGVDVSTEPTDFELEIVTLAGDIPMPDITTWETQGEQNGCV